MILKKNIYINIEIVTRELSSQILLSLFAIRKNFRIYLGDLYSLKKILELKKNKEGIFISKGNLNNQISKLVSEKCDTLVCLDHEITPGFSNKYYQFFIKNRFANKNKNKIDLFFCINEQIKKNFIKSLNLSKNKVVASGWPKFDLYRKEFKNLYTKEKKQLKKKYKKYYLFNSDYGILTKDDANRKIELMQKYGSKSKKLEKIFYQFHTNDFKNLKFFLNKLKKSKKFPRIVFRPHPCENLDEWKTIKDIDSRFIIHPPIDDVSPLIEGSDGVIHRGCTTAFQSLILKKKTGYLNISKGLKKVDRYRSFLFHNSFNLNSVNSLLNWFKISKNKKIHKLKIYDLLNISRQYSCEKIVNELIKLKVSQEKKQSVFKLYKDSELKIGKIKNLIYDLLANLKIVKERNFFKKGSQEKISSDFNKYKIRNYINFYKNVLNMKNKKISVRKITDNLFEIDETY